MPVKTGLELLKELRASNYRYANIPFLMLTSKSEVEMVVTCVKLGASQYLIKPWDSKTLYSKVSEALKMNQEEE